MKNIIYLSLLAAVLLCSCKGNSYMTQRYTHYSHGAKKTSTPVAAVKADTKTAKNEIAIRTAVQENNPGPLASANTAAADKIVTTENMAKPAAANINHQALLPKVKDLGRIVNFPSQRLVKASAEKQNASTAHRGLIFGLIDLALFIIIVAVIVAIVLFLLLVVI